MTHTPVTTSRRVVPDGIPVVNYDHSSPSDALQHFATLMELAEQGPILWNEFGPGFWVITDYELVKEAYQNYEAFSSDSIIATDPNPQHKWIPTMVNPPEHVKYRQLLNTVFSPAAVAKHEAGAGPRSTESSTGSSQTGPSK